MSGRHTIAEVLERVEASPSLAATYLSAELESPKPRKTLISKLEAILEEQAADDVPPMSAKARAMWEEYTRDYELNITERETLLEACRLDEVIERMAERMEFEPLMVDGSMGQPVINPIIPELRQYRSTKARLLASIKLPDDPTEGAGERSAAAREAARARWGGR